MIIFIFSAFSLASQVLGANSLDFLSKLKVAGGPEAKANLVLVSNPLSFGGFNGQSLALGKVQESIYQDSVSKAVYGLPVVKTAGKAEDFLAEEALSSSILIYEVQSGDTLLSLVEQFGISKETIVNANRLENTELEPGQKLIVLPVSGILHEVESGEDIFSLADSYGVSAARISLANSLSEGEQLVFGEKLIIPGGAEKTEISLNNQQLKAVDTTFRMPTLGWNWGKLHNRNAVDIANDCGTPVYAAAAGTVQELANNGLNNSGYGNYLKLNHGAGVKTLYAHLSAVFVATGDPVNQGDLIGSIGRTGNVVGSSGCHLHFEVHGAPNPFAK